MIQSSIRNEASSKKINMDFFFKTIFIFGLIYDINFTFLPNLTTARICFLILLITSVLRKVFLPKSGNFFIFVMLIILCISMLQFSYSGDSTQISRIIWFTIYGIVTPFLFINWIKSKNEFLSMIIIAVAIQSLLSIISFINPAVKSLFYNLIVYTSNYNEDLTLRAAGFASIGGAALSVIQSLGIISSLILLKINNFKFYKIAQIWAIIILILISTIFIGRTGLFISLLCIFLYFLTEIKNIKSIVIFFLICFVVYQINLISILDNATSGVKDFDINLFTDWIENAFKLKGNETTSDLSSMPIPPISSETILGTGKIVSSSGFGNASGHDSGYIQTYFSLGLLTSVIFYFSYLMFLKNKIIKAKNNYLFILPILMFVIEIKEPFIFQYIIPFFILSVILIFEKEALGFKLKKINNNINLRN